MNSMIELRMECIKVASSLRDVSSECVIDVADKIVNYVKGNVPIPETYDPAVEAQRVVNNIMQKFQTGMW